VAAGDPDAAVPAALRRRPNQSEPGDVEEEAGGLWKRTSSLCTLRYSSSGDSSYSAASKRTCRPQKEIASALQPQ
jgi:hypothetical protein